ncbi:TPA: anaerobic sulfatase maturase [Salmonella enterica subsp. enterica serovar Cerro]
MMFGKSCQVMVKPTGSVCNLDCKYCFYLEKEKLYPDRKNHYKMSEETLELFIRQQIAAQDIDEVIFAWQGGEPTLMGIPFYRKAVEFQQRYCGGKTIVNTFQTNGILINDDWATFFREHDFLVGVSIDGDAALHDEWRVTRSGKPTHEKVENAVRCLAQHNVEFNTLTVVNRTNMHHPVQVYRYLKSIGSRYMQFIPLVERCGENGLAQPQVCVFAPTCGSAFAMEMNGDVYNCDHFVYPQFKLGNIHQKTLRQMNQGEQNRQFGSDKQRSMAQECHRCQWKFACYGGCPKHRFLPSASGATNHNYLCAGYQAFFSHTATAMSAMRTLYEKGISPAEIKSIFV